jgi:hypothetical protein
MYVTLGLAIVIFVSCCHKYVYGTHNLIAWLYLPILPVTLYRAAQKALRVGRWKESREL